MGMHQETYVINCPFHGGLIEVVSPHLGRTVRSVFAKAQWDFVIVDAKLQMLCPECRKSIWVYWLYQ